MTKCTPQYCQGKYERSSILLLLTFIAKCVPKRAVLYVFSFSQKLTKKFQASRYQRDDRHRRDRRDDRGDDNRKDRRSRHEHRLDDDVKPERIRRDAKSRSRSRSADRPSRHDRAGSGREGGDLREGRQHQHRQQQQRHPKYEWGRPDRDVKAEPTDEKKPPPQPKQMANMGLSGKLAEDTNMYKGVLIKYSEPANARMPKKRWRLYPFKGEEAMKPLYIHRQSGYLMGRDRKVADIPLDHPSISKQHAALQYRLVEVEQADGSKQRVIKPYIIDLESANGTYLNGERIEARRYVELKERDVLKFGYSSREYVMLSETAGEGGGGDGGGGGGGEDRVPPSDSEESDTEAMAAVAGTSRHRQR